MRAATPVNARMRPVRGTRSFMTTLPSSTWTSDRCGAHCQPGSLPAQPRSLK